MLLYCKYIASMSYCVSQYVVRNDYIYKAVRKLYLNLLATMQLKTNITEFDIWSFTLIDVRAIHICQYSHLMTTSFLVLFSAWQVHPHCILFRRVNALTLQFISDLLGSWKMQPIKHLSTDQRQKTLMFYLLNWVPTISRLLHLYIYIQKLLRATCLSFVLF